MTKEKKRHLKHKRVVEQVPKSIREHRLSWLLKTIWNRAHNKNRMFSAISCAKPGAGKTWITLALAETLDRSHGDTDRFSIDRVYFSAREFAEGMSKEWKKGTVHIFDDAGLNLFSREAMLSDVKDIAKIFQSVRYKNYILFLSVPGIQMIDKVVRQLLDAYIEPIDIDYELERTEAKFFWLQVNPRGKGDKIYVHRPEFLSASKQPFLNYNIVERKLYNTIWIDRPSEKLAEEYENKRKNFMDNYLKSVAASIRKREEKKTEVKSSKYEKYYRLVKESLDFFRAADDNRKISPYAILAKYPECGTYVSKMIARVVNIELEKGLI